MAFSIMYGFPLNVSYKRFSLTISTFKKINSKQVLKVSENGTLLQLLCFWALSLNLFYI
jgi:hypothetical protein